MIKNKILSFFFIFIIIFSLSTNSLAQNETLNVKQEEKSVDIKIPAKPQEKQEGITNILLWEVIAPESNTKSYFAGTIHLPLKEGFEIPESFLDHISQSNKFVNEIDLSDMSGMPLIVSKYGFDKSTGVQKALSPEKWKILVKKMKKAGLEEKIVKMIKPWYLVLILEVDMIMESNDIKKPVITEKDSEKITTPNLMDTVLESNAQIEHMDIVHLETMEEQIKIISSALSNQEYIKMLDEMLTLEKLKKSGKNIKKDALSDYRMIETYNNNDLGKFAQMSRDTEKYSLKYYDSLIRLRNEKWIVKLEHMMQEENLFVAVGALHLIGNKGIIKTLEDKGYKVNFIPLNRN